MSSAYVSVALKEIVRQRAGNRCEYCLLPQSTQASPFHFDHVYPRARGGKTQSNNLALACVWCSLRKNDRTHGKDPLSGKRHRLFNPRIDVWNDHFNLGTLWFIEGRTGIGRATVGLLDPNNAMITEMRATLMFLDLLI